MKVAKKCPKCGHNILTSETVYSRTRLFKNGSLISRKDLSSGRRVFCNGCNDEITPGKAGKREGEGPGEGGIKSRN